MQLDGHSQREKEFLQLWPKTNELAPIPSEQSSFIAKNNYDAENLIYFS